MTDPLQLFFLSGAKKYLLSISDADQGAIDRDTASLARGDRDAVHTKQLRGSIRELISGHHRLIYFQIGSTIFFVRGFRKKSQKTPRQEIEYAEAMFKRLNKSK